jgi:hypothetical protein
MAFSEVLTTTMGATLGMAGISRDGTRLVVEGFSTVLEIMGLPCKHRVY